MYKTIENEFKIVEITTTIIGLYLHFPVWIQLRNDRNLVKYYCKLLVFRSMLYLQGIIS